jgi:hypothetical protein
MTPHEEREALISRKDEQAVVIGYIVNGDPVDEIDRPMTVAEAINFVAGLTESKDTVRVQLEGGMILRWSDCVDLKRRYKDQF